MNDAGVTFALINWYSVQARVSANAVSRGQLVRFALAVNEVNSVDRILKRFPLERTNPFRLIAVFHDSNQVIEWRWNLSAVHRDVHDWKTNVWISSGYDEAGAQRTRRLVLDRLIEQELAHGFPLASRLSCLALANLRPLLGVYAPERCCNRKLHRDYSVRADSENALFARPPLLPAYQTRTNSASSPQQPHVSSSWRGRKS